MLTKLSLIFITLCLLSSTHTQSFSGGVIPHFHTGTMTAELSGELLQNYAYSVTLDRAPFSSGEEVLIGTTLRDYSFLNTQVNTAGASYYVHI